MTIEYKPLDIEDSATESLLEEHTPKRRPLGTRVPRFLAIAVVAFFSAAILLSFAHIFTRPPVKRQALVPSAYDTWIWDESLGNVCANGSPTGFGYSMHPNATELVIYFAGGGGCWNTQRCFTKPTSVDLKGYNSSRFLTHTRKVLEMQLPITSRDPRRNNPWANAHHIYVPYCTGDFHLGNNVVTYDGAPAAIHHKGRPNFENILKFASNAMPDVKDVWMSGSSAGCFGATVNYVAAKKTWPSARTHLIGDSCVATPGLLNTKPTWKLTQPSTRDCPECQQGEFNTFVPALSKANPNSRFGSISFAQDSILPIFMPVRPSYADFGEIITEYFANVTSTPTNMAKTFTVPAKDHVVFFNAKQTSASNVTLNSWLQSMHDLGSEFQSV